MKAEKFSEKYICTLSLTSALSGCLWLSPSLGLFTLGKFLSTNFIRSWVGPEIGR